MKILLSILKKIIRKFFYILKNSQFFTYISFFKNVFNLNYFSISFSQEGEDMILKTIINNESSRFYIDIGAHHPKRFSNTYYFYKQGWKGINIDPLPGVMKLFSKVRPRDINLEIAIGIRNEELTYYMFNESALNGFLDEEKLNDIIKNGYILLSKKNIKTRTLKEVLEKYMTSNIIIDFMTIDVEGMELDVLKSNNWEKYNPEILLVEFYGNTTFEKIGENPVYNFLQKKGYTLIANTRRTFFFKKNK